MLLKDRVVIITGASKGLGVGIAEMCAAEGARVVLAARSFDRLAELGISYPQVVDTLEIFRDMLSGMVEIYFSAVNNRLNEVMKMLTMIATIFMPLSFIAGVYGMNFRYMPELGSPWGYPLALLLMLAVGVSMTVYAAEPGSPSEHGLQLLASWASDPIATAQRTGRVAHSPETTPEGR